MTQHFFILAVFLALLPLSLFPHEFSVGPQCYHVKRVRKGGTEQTGWLGGIRAKYEYFAPCFLYAGIEGAYGRGNIKGKTGKGDALKSQFSELNIEGRLGLSVQGYSGCCPRFTLYSGYGHFIEENNYIHPSSSHFHFRNIFDYVPFGGIFRATVNDRLSFGLEAAGWFSLKGKIKVTHDPKYSSSFLHYEHKVHARVSVPIYYTFCCESELAFTPFFEFRRYGRHHNIPFDFLDTQIKIYGLVLYYRYCF